MPIRGNRCMWQDIGASPIHSEVKPCRGKIRRIDPRTDKKEGHILNYYSCEEHWQMSLDYARGES